MAEYFDRMDALLGDTSRVLSDFVGRIRMEYVMDEFYDGKDEVKFRRSGKTLVTLYLHEGYFTVLIIFGKAEREKFEAQQAAFPAEFCEFYHASRTYHDGKWMFYDVHADGDVDMLMRLLHIRKRPNRKPEKLAGAVISLCGNRCDQCLLHQNHFEPEKFTVGEKHCYFSWDEPAQDHTNDACPGCMPGKGCKYRKCAAEKDIFSCGECDYEHCTTEHFTEPGCCNLGITAEEVAQFILPYCGKERFTAIKSAKTK
ncbi:MAG: DUF3788 family protein [Clostridia bacterium]|nr:DUF3788 family protein [Clostridia bacterium]